MIEQIPNPVQEDSGGSSVVMNMPDYTSLFEQQIQLLETQNEILLYALAGIWVLVAGILVAVFFVGQGAGNNS